MGIDDRPPLTALGGEAVGVAADRVVALDGFGEVGGVGSGAGQQGGGISSEWPEVATAGGLGDGAQHGDEGVGGDLERSHRDRRGRPGCRVREAVDAGAAMWAEVA